ncbi:MAG: hypothetical protein LBJ10_01320 [Clostridiales bacterium]|jgi:hypothetical protein|nr:hypothetical protein [Clostridiales bacterium]
MKTQFVKVAALLLVSCALAAAVSAAAFAVPSAEASMAVSGAEAEGDEIIVTVDIAVTAPSEPYASLDFNLITSDRAKLSVIDLNDDPEVAELDISFAPGYGSAYHQGQDDPDTGGYRYLVGIYSQTAGNLIDGAVDVCSVRLRYSGDEPQSLRLRDMKLVYVGEGGDVLFEPVATDAEALAVDASLVAELSDEPDEPVEPDTLDIQDAPVALGAAEPTPGDAVEADLPEMPVPLSEAVQPGRPWYFYAMWIAIAAAACCAAVILIRRRRKRRAG